MKNRLYIAAIALLSVAACNYTVGECWPVGQGEGDATVGSGPVLSGGTSGDWDTPPSQSTQPCNATESEKKEKETPKAPAATCPPAPAGVQGTWPTAGEDGVSFCSAGCADKCVSAPHGFSPAVFVFTTTLPDDGKDDAGGWQQATATLHFYRWTSVLPESWTCSVKVGMPIRAVAYGVISSKKAGTMAAQVATIASFTVMNEAAYPPGIYCSKLKYQMGAEFPLQFPDLGAKMM